MNVDAIFQMFNEVFGPKGPRPIKYTAPQLGENQGPMIDAGYKAEPPFNAWRKWVSQ